MFERLIQIFSGPHPLRAVGRQFAEMLDLANSMVVQASASYWGAHLSPRERQLLHERDFDVNRLQRSIRRELSERIASATPGLWPL